MNTSLGNIHQIENLCDIANTQMERVSDYCLMTNEEFFSYIMAISFIDGGNKSTH
jgi:hypothetical protein